MDRPAQRSSRRTGHLTFIPRTKLYGVFDDLGAVRDLAGRLLALGLADSKIAVLEGEDGARDLDADGRHHGLVARFVRYLQSMTDERMHAETYVRELLAGRYVVAVALRGEAERRAVCEAFKASGGHYINYYGAFVTEQIVA